LLDATHHLLAREEIPLLRSDRSRKRAELAVLDAHVREVDVAIHDVADALTNLLAAKLVRDEAQGVEVGAPCLAEDDSVDDTELATIEAPFEYLANAWRNVCQAAFEDCRHGVASSK
jgi:hypothetical protein